MLKTERVFVGRAEYIKACTLIIVVSLLKTALDCSDSTDDVDKEIDKLSASMASQHYGEQVYKRCSLSCIMGIMGIQV